MEQQHDRSYHRLFSEPALVEDLVRHFVDEPWVNELDFTKMVRINTKFHSDALERRDGDIIVSIPFLEDAQREIFLYLLLEFQSSVDQWMALRFGTYVHLLYEQLVKEKRLAPDGRLPPVFPLLLYNGDIKWHASADIKSLISLPPNTPLWQWQPNMRYYLIDESCYPEGKAGSLSGLVFRLENAITPQDFKAALEDMVHTIPSHLDSVKRAFAVWITHVLAPHKGIQLKPRDTKNFDEVNDMLSTRIRQWERDFKEEGREKGLEEGRKEGEAALLFRLLELKFGPIPQWATDNIANADKNALENWSLKLISADNLDEIFK